MDNEIQLISDGYGLAIIGESTAVERFLASEGLDSKDLGLPRLGSVLSAGGAVAQASSEIAANSGRWVKLTKESSKLVKKHGLRESSKSGLSTGVVKGNKGQIKGFVEFAKGPGGALSNPALLAGAAGIMAQLAMQQTMDEITDYLARIDEKLDDVLRSQTNQVLARMDAVDLAAREAMTVRDSVGRVSEVTWSKVQATSSTIFETQAYALRQLNDLAEKLERKSKVGDLAKATKDAQSEVQKWLAVLARCVQLHDAVAVLELDRVLDASPEELDRHRLGLRAARHHQLELISRSTQRLIGRMDTAAGTANSKVLLHPAKAPALVESSNQVSGSILDFHGLLGIERDREALEARRWRSAASEVTEKALEKGADRVDVAKRVGSETFGKAKTATGRVSARISERTFRRGDEESGAEHIDEG
ncbi:hypothetical protein [Nocardioides sp. ChNu-99]|uniref:hypothetical protein n=1 Tax=Nocardioides sp. ChNu-99 TaxID=2839897 RepID=UPI0024059C2A|nr:hypothetical protein [Nocardioides sp. ChNu-99]MDF9717338.1 hypothetical protein [Nocardioides sp. ChNu-99]